MTNTGNVTLTQPVTVADDLATVICPTDLLAPGATITCTATTLVTQDDVDSGAVINTASASSGTTISNADSATTRAAQAPELTLGKTATPAGYATVGQIVTYEYTLTNTSNVTLDGPFTVIDDRIPTVACPADLTLPPGAALTCTADYTITQADLDAGTVVNHATASATFAGADVDSGEASAVATADKQPAIALDKTVTPRTFNGADDVLEYSYLVTNTGNVTLTDPVTVTDDRTTVTCPTTLLAPLDTLTCTATYTTTQADVDAGAVINTATANSATTSSPPDTATALALQSPQLSLDKTGTPPNYDSPGDVVSYTYALTNTSNVTLEGPLDVTDDRTSVTCPAILTLAPGATVECTASYTITQADIDAGTVTNHATGHAVFDSNAVVSDPATFTVIADKQPALELEKTVAPAIYGAVGTTLSYTYLVTNTGNVTMTAPVTITDDRTTVTCPTTLLRPTSVTHLHRDATR